MLVSNLYVSKFEVSSDAASRKELVDAPARTKLSDINPQQRITTETQSPEMENV
jgi:hypothetical protein